MANLRKLTPKRIKPIRAHLHTQTCAKLGLAYLHLEAVLDTLNTIPLGGIQTSLRRALELIREVQND